MFRKTITAGLAVAVLAVPTAAMADQAEYQGYPVNDSPAAQDWLAGDSSGQADGQFKGSLVGELTSRITHNGQYVQDQMGEHGRSDVVQTVHALDGKGRNK
jgi:hypothetical protein